MDLIKIFNEFLPKEDFVAYKRFGNGHINSTFLVISAKFDTYVIQKINHYAFKDIDLLMNNICEVTNHLKSKNIESIQMLKATNGKYYVEEQGEFYRMYRFMDYTMTFEKPEGLKTVRNAAEAFGRFHKNLSDLDASKLGETIPHFHDTPKRYRDLLEAAKEDKAGRLKNVSKEMAKIKEYSDKFSLITDGLASGEVKLHITHNDPKINNALFDENSREFRSIIDLDTVMPGSVLYDFGDALRSLFTGDKEDSLDYKSVVGDLEIYQAYLESYYKETSSFLTKREKELLPYAPFVLAIELVMRFLEDYLRGDVYFGTNYPEHNLDRARTQLNLATSIIENIADYQKITDKVIKDNNLWLLKMLKLF